MATKKRSQKKAAPEGPSTQGRTKERPWNPNSQTFEQGRPYVEKQLKAAGLGYDKIVTSKDPRAKKLRQLLSTNNAPRGFKKFQLPFAFFQPTNMYVTEGAPGAEVAEHAHTEGPGMRYIVEGSIKLGRHTLGPGDWVYIPAGAAYSFRVGRKRARMVATYQC
jgi:hypothetical protein